MHKVHTVEYDSTKAAANLRKHGVPFEEAATALLDPEALAMEDRDAEDEPRWLLLGMSERGNLLAVVYTLRDETPRLISARRATKNEAKRYAQ